jgi:hypothetical protein
MATLALASLQTLSSRRSKRPDGACRHGADSALAVFGFASVIYLTTPRASAGWGIAPHRWATVLSLWRNVSCTQRRTDADEAAEGTRG